MPLFCTGCLSTSLSLVNSTYVCDECGMQTEIVEVEAGEGDMVTHARRTFQGAGVSAATMAERSAEAEAQKAAIVAASKRDEVIKLVEYDEKAVIAKVKYVAEVYARALQLLVRAQADALVDRFGGPPECRALMRNIWFAFVPFTGLLDADSRVGGTVVHGYLDAAGYPAIAREGCLWESFKAGGRPIGRERFKNLSRFHFPGLGRNDWYSSRVHSYIRKLLPPSTTLAMTMLTCLMLRMPVTPMDVVRWAYDQSLPYQDLRVRAAPLIERAPIQFFGKMLQPLTAPDPILLLAGAVEMGGLLGFEIPPLNVDGLLVKMSDSLGLPRAVSLVSKELYRMYLPASPLLHPQALSIRGTNPYMPLAALLFASLKICYGLDNRGAAEVEAAEQPGKKRAARKRRPDNQAQKKTAPSSPGGSTCEVAQPLLPGVPPMVLPPGGWPAWAAKKTGEGLRIPFIETPQSALQAAHLPYGELRAFMEGTARCLARFKYSRKIGKLYADDQKLCMALDVMSHAALKSQIKAAADGAADAPASLASAAAAAAAAGSAHEIMGDSDGRVSHGIEGGEGHGGAPGGAATAEEPALESYLGVDEVKTRDHWRQVKIAVAGPSAAALAGLSHVIPPDSGLQSSVLAQPSPTSSLHDQTDETSSRSEMPPVGISWPRPSVVQSQLRPRGLGLLAAKVRLPPREPWLHARFILQGQQMHADAFAVVGMLAWLYCVKFQEMLRWVQALVMEMAEIDELARRTTRLMRAGMPEAEALEKVFTGKPRIREWRRMIKDEACHMKSNEGEEEEPVGKRKRGRDNGRGGGRGQRRSQGGALGQGQDPSRGRGRGRGQGRGRRPGRPSRGRGRGRGHQVDDSSDNYEDAEWYEPTQPVTVQDTGRPRRAAAVTAAKNISGAFKSTSFKTGIKEKPMSPMSRSAGGGGSSCGSGKKSSSGKRISNECGKGSSRGSETSSTRSSDDSSSSEGDSEDRAPGSEDLAEQVARSEIEKNDDGDFGGYVMEVDEPGQAASHWRTGKGRSLRPQDGLREAARGADVRMTNRSDEVDSDSSSTTDGDASASTGTSGSADMHTNDGAGSPVHSRAGTDNLGAGMSDADTEVEGGGTDMDGDDERSEARVSEDEEDEGDEGDEGEQLLLAIRAAAGRKQQHQSQQQEQQWQQQQR